VSSIASQVLERKSVSKLEADSMNHSELSSSTSDEKVLRDALGTLYTGIGTFVVHDNSLFFISLVTSNYSGFRHGEHLK
jgi:hypothetical protein